MRRPVALIALAALGTTAAGITTAATRQPSHTQAFSVAGNGQPLSPECEAAFLQRLPSEKRRLFRAMCERQAMAARGRKPASPLPAPPVVTTAPLPPDVRRCGASDLEAALLWTEGVSGGQMASTLALRDRSPTP